MKGCGGGHEFQNTAKAAKAKIKLRAVLQMVVGERLEREVLS